MQNLLFPDFTPDTLATDELDAWAEEWLSRLPLANADEHLVARRVKTPIGPMVAVGSGQALVTLEFVEKDRIEKQLRRLAKSSGAEIAVEAEAAKGLPQAAILDAIEAQVADYFAGERRAFDVPLGPIGTEFQERVWAELAKIPYGEQRTYGEIALALEHPKASRAVGSANGLNPIAIVVPCHRVVGADGTLTGYGGGLWRKRRLLELEGHAPAKFA